MNECDILGEEAKRTMTPPTYPSYIFSRDQDPQPMIYPRVLTVYCIYIRLPKASK